MSDDCKCGCDCPFCEGCGYPECECRCDLDYPDGEKGKDDGFKTGPEEKDDSDW
ncbi:hypothetical protein JW752_03315 [Candidatus Peregrinibacteria bacterium]|nr:hypothetical protein [Candidatus Peregrinibacteria bacterium]